MSFFEHPTRHLRFARRSRDPVRDACAVEQFAPRTRRSRLDGHRFITAACLLAGLVVIVIIASEKFA